MKEWLNRYLQIGIHPGVSKREQKHIVLLNALILITQGMMIGYVATVITFWPGGSWYLLIGYGIIMILYLASLWLNHLRFYLGARLLFNIPALVLTVFQTFFFGSALDIHLFLLLIGVAAMFLYGRQDRFVRYTLLGIALAMYWAIEFYAPEIGEFYPGDQALARLIGASVQIGFAGAMLAFLAYIAANYARSEDALEAEQQKAERLLLNVLPQRIADRLKETQDTIADAFDNASVLFADIVGFTPLAQRTRPAKLVDILNQIFTRFDDLAERYNVEKIKTIGDAYMVAAGIPEPIPNHASALADFALEMRKQITRFKLSSGGHLAIRIGIHSGPVVAGVISKKKFTYDL